jgi:hypothetical protein
MGRIQRPLRRQQRKGAIQLPDGHIGRRQHGACDLPRRPSCTAEGKDKRPESQTLDTPHPNGGLTGVGKSWIACAMRCAFLGRPRRPTTAPDASRLLFMRAAGTVHVALSRSTSSSQRATRTSPVVLRSRSKIPRRVRRCCVRAHHRCMAGLLDERSPLVPLFCETNPICAGRGNGQPLRQPPASSSSTKTVVAPGAVWKRPTIGHSRQAIRQVGGGQNPNRNTLIGEGQICRLRSREGCISPTPARRSSGAVSSTTCAAR